DEVGVGGVEIERPEREVHAEHQELAVGEVDHAHDPEDQGQPDRDEGVDSPEQDRRDREGDENAYLRWSQAPSGIHLARSVVNSSGHTVTSCPFCHCSMQCWTRSLAFWPCAEHFTPQPLIMEPTRMSSHTTPPRHPPP